MMAQRSLLRPDQLDTNGSYQFAQLIIDGYSGGELQDGYLMGLVLKDGYVGGSETLRINAHNGAINQIGSGQVTFNGNVLAVENVIIGGDLTVQGTTTTIDTEQMIVTDPITVINAYGSELLSDWTGFTARDVDGYNRIGWVFDGYWAISSAFAGPETVPDRALAFLGDGYTNGNLSSTVNGDSGADKIGVTVIPGINGNNVQVVLEALDVAIDNIEIEMGDLEQGTTYNQWTINTDATTANEDACLVLSGGDGTSIIDGYLCLVTDSVGGDRFQMQLYGGGNKQTTDLHLGTENAVTSADAILTFNAGNGADAYQATIMLDGNSAFQGNLVYTALVHEFAGNVQPVTDCTYQLGDETHKFLDAYFCLFTPTNYTPHGSNSSIEGHLKGIDEALIGGGVALKPERGVFYITNAEASADTLDTSRAVDQGEQVNVSGWTNTDFRDYAYIYWNGQLLRNDPTSAANKGAVQNDVARQTGTLKKLIFAGDLKKGSTIQVVDMR